MTGTIPLAAAAFALVDAAAFVLLSKSPGARRFVARAALALLVAAGVVLALCMSVIVLAASANAQEEVPLIHVHSAANTNEGGGSWAWSAGGMNPTIRAAMPSPAAVTLLDLRVGDSVSFDGTVPDTWEVIDRMVWGKDKGGRLHWPACEATVEVTKLNGYPVSLCLDGPRPV